jgi:hypothetical protein
MPKKWLNPLGWRGRRGVEVELTFDRLAAEHAVGNPSPHQRRQPSTHTLMDNSVTAFRARSSPIALHLTVWEGTRREP